MPIDFRQVAAPSFSDSNTLVALAAKQQQEAMTGIQGAWTGAMDAVGNRVQGELEGIANQASLTQLTDPVQRQALETQLMNANTLGMGDINALNKYTDNRIGTQIGRFTTLNQEGRNAAIEKDRYDANQLLVANDAETKAINEGIFIASDFQNQIEAAETQEKKDQLRAQMDNALGGYGYNQAQMAKVNAGYEKQSQETRINNHKEILISMGIPYQEAQTQALQAETMNSTARTGVLVNQALNKDGNAAISAARKAASESGFAGSINDSGGINYDMVKQRLDTNYSAAKQKGGVSNPDDPTTFDEYAVKNAKKIDEMGLGSFMRSASLDTLQGHFRWAQENDAPYTEAEKIAAAEGLMSGAIKMDMFAINPNPLTQNGESFRVGKALREQLVPLMNSRESERSTAAGKEEVLKAINFLTDNKQTTEEILTNLGIVTSDHPYAKHLPENFLAAVKVMEKMPKLPDNYVEETGVGKTKKNLVSANDILKGAGTVPPATSTTEKLPTLPNKGTAASNVPATTSYNPGKQKGNINNLVTKSGKTIPRDAVTPQMAKEANVKMVNGNLKWEDRFKGKTMETVYGEKIKINDVKDLERFIQVNYSGHVKEVQNVLANNGKSKYKYPTDLSKIDKNHPLAHPDSDNPNNFVPYEARNFDGSRKYKTKYSSYDTYVKLTLNKKLGRKNK